MDSDLGILRSEMAVVPRCTCKTTGYFTTLTSSPAALRSSCCRTKQQTVVDLKKLKGPPAGRKLGYISGEERKLHHICRPEGQPRGAITSLCPPVFTSMIMMLLWVFMDQTTRQEIAVLWNEWILPATSDGHNFSGYWWRKSPSNSHILMMFGWWMVLILCPAWWIKILPHIDAKMAKQAQESTAVIAAFWGCT